MSTKIMIIMLNDSIIAVFSAMVAGFDLFGLLHKKARSQKCLALND